MRLAEGPGSPGWVTLYTGGRGTGKTVMLNAAEDIARAAGFKVISETASAGFVATADRPAPSLAAAEAAAQGGRGVDRPGGRHHARNRAPAPSASLRSLIERITLDQRLLISLDEINNSVLDELRELAVVLQHAVREQRPFAFVGAGLPSAVEHVLNDKVLTFLRPRRPRTRRDPSTSTK